jgi:hypothetical protein
MYIQKDLVIDSVTNTVTLGQCQSHSLPVHLQAPKIVLHC